VSVAIGCCCGIGACACGAWGACGIGAALGAGCAVGAWVAGGGWVFGFCCAKTGTVITRMAPIATPPSRCFIEFCLRRVRITVKVGGVTVRKNSRFVTSFIADDVLA
jgi:hypothetical protein